MKVLLLGLGRANLYVARYLLQKGDDIFLYEENMDNLNEESRKLVCNGKIKIYQKMNYDLAVCSPGFPDSKPIIQDLRNRGVEVIDETEFTYNNLENAKIIAVTGTNGKSTTAALINNILSIAGINNFLGGNIAPGKPFSAALFENPYDYYVLEMSSFQLMRIKNFRPSVAVLTNIAFDHLNWHRDLNEYVEAKKRIFLNQTADDYAILNYDDERIREMEKIINARSIFFGIQCYNGAWLNGVLHFQDEEIIADYEIPLLGRHNHFNVLASIAVAKVLKISKEDIKKGIMDFKPLPHRLEEIGIIDGIRYINNSMSTNEASAIASFLAVSGDKVVIIGGREKGDRCENYLNLLIKEAKGIVILGENAKDIARFLQENHYERFTTVEDMNEAVKKAREFARIGDIIMLNPGFASFGNFRDFQERGEAFKDAVLKD